MLTGDIYCQYFFAVLTEINSVPSLIETTYKIEAYLEFLVGDFQAYTCHPGFEN